VVKIYNFLFSIRFLRPICQSEYTGICHGFAGFSHYAEGYNKNPLLGWRRGSG
jgi:hypothetical protein